MEQLERDIFLSDKELLCTRFGKATGTYDQNAVVQFRIHEKLIGLLRQTGKKSFARAIDIGCGSGNLSKLLLKEFNIDELYLNDLCKKWGDTLAKELNGRFNQFYACDGEQFPFEGIFDLVVSSSTMQWFHQPEQFIDRVAAHTSTGSTLLLSTFGEKNFHEIRAVTGKGLSYPASKELEKWLNYHFDISIVYDEFVYLQFNSPLDVLRHMKKTGVTATSTGFWSKKRLDEFCKRYAQLFNENGKVRLTYHPVYIWATKR